MNLNEFSDSDWDPAHSPFTEIIGTNHSPSSDELAELKRHLDEPKSQLSKLESEIHRVQTLLSSLESERDRVKVYVDAHEALISPIRRLPSETLAEIFTACLPATSYCVRSVSEAPLLFTLICRDWRHITVNTPRMWTSLHIYVPSVYTDSFSLRQAGTVLWLERSRTLPLSISLYIENPHRPRPGDIPDSENARTRAMSILQTVMQYSDRLSDLSLLLPREHLSMLELQLPEQLPLLQSLHLSFNLSLLPATAVIPTEDTAAIFTSLVKRSPKLRKLRIPKSAIETASYLTLARGWGNLTYVSLNSAGSGSRWHTNDILMLLSLTARLVSCDFVFHCALEPGAAQMQVQLGSLHTLNISLRVHPSFEASEDEIEDPTWIYDLFANMTCPSLKSFSIGWNGQPLVRCPFATLPLHDLEGLKMDIPMTTEALSQCLSLVPNITLLEISENNSYHPDWNFNDYLLAERHLSQLSLSPFEPNAVAAPCCPKLQTIKLSLNRRPGQLSRCLISGAAVASFVEHRVKTLETCDIFLSSEKLLVEGSLTEEATLRLRASKSTGLKLCIKCRRPTPPVYFDGPSTGLSSQRDTKVSKNVITLV